MDPKYVRKIKKHVPAHMPDPTQGFRLAVVSPSMSGKSFRINDMLTNPKYGYNKIFDPMCTFIFSPTFEYDESYKALRKRMKGYEDNVLRDVDFAFMDDIVSRQQTAKRKKKARPTLLLIDDLVLKLNPRKLTTLTDLFYSGRHSFISIILSSQSYKSIPRAMRLNCCSMIFFVNNLNSSEKKCVADEAPDDSFLYLCKHLETHQYNRYDFLFLNFKLDRYNRWMRCFDKKLNVKALCSGDMPSLPKYVGDTSRETEEDA
jgi:hypothetical protein